MGIRRRLLTTVIAGLLSLPSFLVAQTRQITGTVTRTNTGAPIAEAIVSIPGTGNATRTDASGRFTLPAPASEVRMTVRAIGFTRKDAVVPPSQNTINFVLDQDIFKLDEVVVSGQVTSIARRNQTTSIGYVSGEDVAKVASPTIEGALYGKLAGVNIQSNSGAPGGGNQFQVRGNNTILGSFDPLYIVDGVIYSNARVRNGRNAIIDGADVNEDEPVNRVADINPADIGSIEVLKGAAASAIYGSKAANGVVIIKTLRGQQGVTRTNVSQRLGAFTMLKGYDSRCFKAADKDAAVASFGPDAAQFFANGDPPCFNHYDQVYGGSRLSYETVADFSGGSDNTKYFVSATNKQDKAIEPNTGFGRQGLRVNVDQKLSPKFTAEVSSVFNRASGDRGWGNNCNVYACIGYALAYTPSFDDLRPGADGAFPNPIGGRNANPLQTVALAKNGTETYRFTGGTTLTYNAHTSERASLRFVAGGGADLFSQQDKVISPVELFYEQINAQPGAVVLTSGTSRQLNYNLSGIHTYRTKSTGGMQFTTSAGLQYEDRQLRQNRTTTRNLVPGQENVNQGTNIIPFEELTRERTFAVYGQEDLLLLDDRLLISGGVRAERSSANGNISKYYVFPRASGKYSFRDLLGTGSDFKLRAGYGEIGTQPNFGNKFTTLLTPQYGGANGFQVNVVAGDPNIRPERVKEIEAGFDANFWNGRVSVDFTAYRRNTTDLLLQRVPAPSTGFTTQIFNGGKIKNEGIEVSLGVTPIQSNKLTWVSQTTFTTTRSLVVDLPVPGFQPPSSGFGGLGVIFIEQGKSLTRIYGSKYDTDGVTPINGDVGNSNPSFRMGFSNTISYKSLNVGFVLDWQQGSNVINLTQLLYDDGATTKDYGSDAWRARITPFFGGDGVISTYVESGTFLKVREISIGAAIPQKWTRGLGLGVRDARISVSGRNLFQFTPYSGLDPEVANFGASSIRSNIDVTPYPPSRSVFFNIALGF
ncbi:MAG: SusC/RagA family TonB-linked outer membrane protein [Gemmatimonadota bacterium]